MNMIAQAAAAVKAGNLKSAEQLCRQVLSQNPANATAVGILGVIAGRVGNHDAAASLLQRAAALDPRVASHHCNYVRALISLEKFEVAQAAATLALEQLGDHAELMALKGIACSNQGNSAEAVELLKKSVALEGNSALSLFNLGEAYRRSGDPDRAREYFERALKIDPRNPEALNNYAGLLLNAGEFVTAMECIEKLLKVQPRSPQAYVNLGHACRMGGAIEAAITSYENALRLDATCDAAMFELASLHLNQGEFEQAEKYLGQLESHDEDTPRTSVLRARIHERQGSIDEADAMISSLYQEQPEDAGVAMCYATVQEQKGNLEEAATALESVLARSETIAADGIGIHFSLGKIYDALKRHDEAFENYHLGNANRKKAFVLPYTSENSQRNFEILRKRYTAESYAALPTATLGSDRPIFIVGMPRSGTSLTEQILASHPEVFGGGELSVLGDLIKAKNDPSKGSAVSGFHFSRDDLKDDESQLLIDAKGDVSVEEMNELAQGYLDQIAKLDAETPRLTDKMPYNFLMLPVIKKLFPQAAVIHCRRNPIDTCLSCYFQNFFRGNQYAFDLNTLADYYKQYRNLMTHWREELQLEFFDLDYEAMVQDPAAKVREILEYCRLPWHDGCLEFHKSKRVIDTASYQQVRQPIYTKSVARWEKYRDHIAPLIEAFEN